MLTVDGGVALTLPFVHKRLHELGRLELDLAHRVLRVELPDPVAHVEYVHPALLDARALRRDLADLQCGGAPADLRGADAEEAAGVVWRDFGDVVEARCDAAVEADELREVGEEAGGLVRLNLAVLDGDAAQVWTVSE